MNRLQKLLAAATLLVLPVIAACGEDPVPPPVTGSIMGQVSIEGMGIDGVSVNLSNGASTTTAGGGTYRFDGVTAGAYTVTISGFPADASFDATSAAATIPAAGGSVTLDFRGSYIRTASIIGTVTVENTGLGGVTVRLSGMADAQTATDNNGQYAFTGLRAGTYAVEISGFDMNEVGFGSVSSSATVGVGESKIISFDGTYLRTAGIMGQVSVEGVGLEGVTVTMTGEGEDETDVTDAGGLYGFSKLKAGDYSVAISGFDPDEVEFSTTSMNVSVALGETANIPFEGTLLRTSGISGRVSVDGMGLDDVEVALTGAAVATAMTSNGGQYAFAGLAEGTYVLNMTNPDANAYNFEETSATIVLGDSESNITNFEGTHTRTASISGVLFIDEVMQDKMHTAGEPSLTAALAPLVEHGLLDPTTLPGLLEHAKVIVRGPSLNDEPMYGQIQLDGSFTVGELVAGSYQVELPANNEMVAAALAAAGVDFVGESAVVTVAAGGDEIVNLPFRITMQTIGVGAVMGSAEELSDPLAPVGGVTLALFPTAQDAAAGTNLLGMGTKTGETGMAGFTFARADDTSPGSDETDNIVFVKVVDAGHEDLMVSDRDVIEVQYPGIARVHGAPTTVRFQNVAVNFQFWIKNDEDARGGDVLVDGWHTDVYMGEVTDESMPLGEMANLTMPSESAEDEDGMQGRVMVSYRVTPDELPATFSAALRPDTDDWQQPMAMGETWEEVGDGLTYTHTGFELPALNTHEVNDLNLNPRFGQAPARVTFTTQKLTVGVYREADDVAGFSDFQSRVSDGDHRPAADVAADLSVSVMVEASGRRGLEVYDEWDHDDDPDTDAIDATIDGLTGGMATFGNLPADMDFTVQFDEGSDRVAVGGPDSRSDRVQTFGDDVELGMSTGAFGDMSGAGPEVELCPLTTDTRPSSLGDDDSDCATFAYQWNTGSITGDVGREVEDLDVSIEADTDLHSDAPRDTETDEDGEFGWSGVQDGVYSIAVASSDDYTVKPKSVRVDVYHDEFEDDKDDDTEFVGTRGTDHADFSATKLRLSIKGYAANISHESNDVVRGDETYEGAELELFAYDEDSDDDIMSTGKAVETATVGADGLYEFNDLDEGAYVIVATNTDDYEMYAAGPDVHYINNVAADTYKDDGVLEEQLTLPYWDYEASDVKNTTSPHTVGTGAAAESFTYYNFALLHGDGEFSGRVFEARGEPGGIAVELRRCETYTPDDATTTDADEERCREDTDFGAQTENAGSSGRWDFASLREGYYVANIAATTYNQAKWDDDGIDDDAANCEGGTAADATCDEARTVDMFGMLEGKSAFNRGGATFRVYNRTLGYDAELSGLVIEGTKDAEDGDEELEDFTVTAHDNGVANDIGTVDDPITYASESITLTPTLEDDNASVRVIVGDLDDPDDTGSGDDGDEIEVDLEMGANTVTVIVTAENAYDDRMYSFEVTRMAPVANTLADLGLRSTRDVAAGSLIPISPAFGAEETEYTATVPTGTGTGTTMSVYVLATVRLLQQAITVTYSDGGTMTELDAENPRNNDGSREKVYKVTIPKTGALNDKSVLVKVTSEDGKALTYDIQLQRGEEGDPTNAPPAFSSEDAFEVEEGKTAVGTVTATDDDPDDDVTGYAITGGADMEQFKIDDDGELTFASAPDFESPSDADGGNDYEVTVTATSGTGDRALTAAQEITVTVTNNPDDDVPTDVPSAPQRLTVSSPASGQLTVSWRAPSDEGALGIDGYEYRVAPTQTWTQEGSDGAVRSVTIEDLTNGLSATIFIRAFGTDADDNHVPGAEGSVTGMPRPDLTVAAPSRTTLTEKDDAATTEVTENETTVSIGLDELSLTSTDVTLMLYAGGSEADPEVESDKAAIVGGSTITFGPGVISKEVTIRADDNLVDDDTDPEFRVVAKVAEDEAEMRAAVVGADAVTITDDDFKPGPVLGTTATAGDAMLTVTWTDLDDHELGVNDTDSKGNGTGFTYQYRYKITVATDDGAWSAWASATHSDDGIEITSLTNGVGYSVEVRGTSSAGDGTAGTATDTPTGT